MWAALAAATAVMAAAAAQQGGSTAPPSTVDAMVKTDDVGGREFAVAAYLPEWRYEGATGM